jgi:hypothetical protein
MKGGGDVVVVVRLNNPSEALLVFVKSEYYIDSAFVQKRKKAFYSKY